MFKESWNRPQEKSVANGKKNACFLKQSALAIILALTKAYMIFGLCLLYGTIIKPWCDYE